MTDLENREAFEKWWSTAKKTLKCDDYDAFEIWQASTRRQGFKLVLLEPTLSMIEAAAEEHATNGASYKTMFKAMINAV